MKVHDFHSVSRSQFRNPVITVGVFDGVHLGHQYLLTILKQNAAESNSESVVFTLWPHPRMVLSPDMPIKLICTAEEKIARIEKQGIDHLVMLNFTTDVAAISAEDFVRNLLVGRLGMKTWIVGYDNHFGKGRAGNYETIKKLGSELGFSIHHPHADLLNNQQINSSTIRVFIEQGMIQKANELLGYQYTLSGTVMPGKQLGQKIGFPTANIQPSPIKMVPADGVYAVWVDFGTMTYKGMVNIGYRPTLNHLMAHKTIEVHIIGFDGDLYNRGITLTFVQKIREEKKFENIDKLIEQLNKDKENIIRILTN